MNNSHSSLCIIFLPNSVSFLLLLLSLGSTNSAVAGSPRFQPQEGQYHKTPFMGKSQSVSESQQTGPFQLCLACKCCAAGTPTPTCATMPCCFAIDCQIPGKPFGVCAFVPKTCDCTSCAV